MQSKLLSFTIEFIFPSILYLHNMYIHDKDYCIIIIFVSSLYFKNNSILTQQFYTLVVCFSISLLCFKVFSLVLFLLSFTSSSYIYMNFFSIYITILINFPPLSLFLYFWVYSHIVKNFLS
jgi:hypothetical protein